MGVQVTDQGLDAVSAAVRGELDGDDIAKDMNCLDLLAVAHGKKALGKLIWGSVADDLAPRDIGFVPATRQRAVGFVTDDPVLGG